MLILLAGAAGTGFVPSDFVFLDNRFSLDFLVLSGMGCNRPDDRFSLEIVTDHRSVDEARGVVFDRLNHGLEFLEADFLVFAEGFT